MADTAMGPPPLERQESVPMEIMNKCAYGEPSTKTIMIMGAVAAVLASMLRQRTCRSPPPGTAAVVATAALAAAGGSFGRPVLLYGGGGASS